MQSNLDQAALVADFDDDDDKTDLLEPDPEPPVEVRKKMLEVVEEAENGFQLLYRPWNDDRYWQVVDPEGTGPKRVGSPNGGVLFSKDDEDRARRYFDINSRVPQDTGRTSVPGHIAAAGRETTVEWLYAYREYDLEELTRRTGLPETTITEILGGGTDGE